LDYQLTNPQHAPFLRFLPHAPFLFFPLFHQEFCFSLLKVGRPSWFLVAKAHFSFSLPARRASPLFPFVLVFALPPPSFISAFPFQVGLTFFAQQVDARGFPLFETPLFPSRVRPFDPPLFPGLNQGSAPSCSPRFFFEAHFKPLPPWLKRPRETNPPLDFLPELVVAMLVPGIVGIS